MKNILFNDLHDLYLLSLLDKDMYFGNTGAIRYFEERYLLHTEDAIAQGKYSAVIRYISILYCAIVHVGKGGIFQKMRVPLLLKNMNAWVEKIRPNGSELRDKFKEDELLILMLITGCNLKVGHMLSFVATNSGLLRHFGVKMYSELTFDLMCCFMVIKRKADEEVSEVKSSAELSNPGPANLALLMAEGLLLELNRQELVELSDQPAISQRLWFYSLHNERSKDPFTLCLIMKFFESIGLPDEAKKISIRSGLPVLY